MKQGIIGAKPARGDSSLLSPESHVHGYKFAVAMVYSSDVSCRLHVQVKVLRNVCKETSRSGCYFLLGQRWVLELEDFEHTVLVVQGNLNKCKRFR